MTLALEVLRVDLVEELVERRHLLLLVGLRLPLVGDPSPIEQVLGDPRQERTRQFLSRVHA